MNDEEKNKIEIETFNSPTELPTPEEINKDKIGRASCRERVCQYV